MRLINMRFEPPMIDMPLSDLAQLRRIGTVDDFLVGL
jgi:hypothetical protein